MFVRFELFLAFRHTERFMQFFYRLSNIFVIRASDDNSLNSKAESNRIIK